MRNRACTGMLENNSCYLQNFLRLFLNKTLLESREKNRNKYIVLEKFSLTVIHLKKKKKKELNVHLNARCYTA